MSDEPNPADQELMRLAIGEDDGDGDAPGDDDGEKKAKPSDAEDDAGDIDERGEDDDAVDDDGDEEENEDGEDDPKRRKPRSKPEGKRVAELTARLRSAERELEALRGGEHKEAEEPAKLEAPNPDDFPMGDIDPGYIDALTDFKIESRDAKQAEAASANREQEALRERLNSGAAVAEEQAKAKYDDFDDRIQEAVEARGGEPLPAPLSVALSVSPVGGDLIYRLATDSDASARLEKLATGDQMPAFALALGELEGEYSADGDDADLDLDDSLDMARMLGRMRSRMKGTKAPEPRKREVKPTNAPEPPSYRTRGGGGRFEVSDDTDDFAAFEAKIMGGEK